MSIQLQLASVVNQAIKDKYGLEIGDNTVQIQPTTPDKTGDFTVILFPLLKLKLDTPENLGNNIGNYLKTNLKEAENFEVIKGFLNVTLSDTFWINYLNDLSTDFEEHTSLKTGVGQTVMVEYSGPNTNKPLHLGHLRNNFLGYAIANILEATGCKVVKANLVNDRGVHICKSMYAWQHFGNDETPESSGIKGDHLVGKYYVLFDKELQKQMKENNTDKPTETPIMKEIQEMLRKWEANDKEVRELWQKMNDWVLAGFDKTYKRCGVSFERVYKESETYLLGKKIVEEGLNKGIFYKKDDGSIWVDLTEFGLDHKLLLRGDGTSVYITQDLGTAQLKYDEYKIDKSIYVIGNEQEYHLKVLIGALKKLNVPYANAIFHLSYGMVELPTGKMKSREGTVVDADDLMEEMVKTAAKLTTEHGKTEGLNEMEIKNLHETLGLGALKYYLLKVDPVKQMLFDPQESIDFKGHTGSFIQHSYARTRSIQRKAVALLFPKTFNPLTIQLLPEEKELLRLLHQFKNALAEAADKHNPSILANYVFEIAKKYNRFYYELPILQAETPEIIQSRLLLSNQTGRIIKKIMNLLGIEVPEQM